MKNFCILSYLITFGIFCHSAPQFDNLNQGKVIVQDERDSQVDSEGRRNFEKRFELGQFEVIEASDLKIVRHFEMPFCCFLFCFSSYTRDRNV